MKYWLLFLGCLMLSCKSDKKYHSNTEQPVAKSKKVKDVLDFQDELNATFKNPETSPLPDRYRKDFEGLEFFLPDTTYRIMARLERTPEAKPFLMNTTTGDKRNEVVYGVAHFELNGISHSLEIYQSKDEPLEGDEDYLFLPFLDDTNGKETYGGGRYIDLRVPEGNTILIDFNKAYNPYCVYNKKYSCPLVPRQNYLRTNMRAGVKDFNTD